MTLRRALDSSRHLKIQTAGPCLRASRVRLPSWYPARVVFIFSFRFPRGRVGPSSLHQSTRLGCWRGIASTDLFARLGFSLPARASTPSSDEGRAIPRLPHQDSRGSKFGVYCADLSDLSACFMSTQDSGNLCLKREHRKEPGSLENRDCRGTVEVFGCLCNSLTYEPSGNPKALTSGLCLAYEPSGNPRRLPLVCKECSC
jgi:hypothetical protein